MRVYPSVVRTTIELDDDTVKAIVELRRETGAGLSEAVNILIRRGLLPRAEPTPFRQRTQSLGISVDVSNVVNALEDLEGIEAR
jgi:hypothetical protein